MKRRIVRLPASELQKGNRIFINLNDGGQFEIQGFELLKKELREKYNNSRSHSRTKIKLSFDELLRLFAEGELSLREISRRLGVSAQRIHQLWDRCFYLFTEYENGKERREQARINKYLAKERECPVIPFLKRVNDKAKDLGYIVLQVINENGRASYKRLRINNKFCSISALENITKRFPNSKSLCSKADLCIGTMRENSFLIVERQRMNKDYEYFIIPTLILLEKFSLGRKRGLFMIYLPMDRYISKKRPKVDFWQYHEAWYLLG